MRYVDEDFSEAEFRDCDLSRARLIGVVMQDAEIDGLITNLVVNGVEVTAFVEAELDRRYPVRALLRSEDPQELRGAWRQLRDGWRATVERVRGMAEGSEFAQVNGEWSMVETLRHLVFVHDVWFRGCVLGVAEPFERLGLGVTSAPDPVGLDRTLRPSLDEVLDVRCRQADELETWLEQLTPDQLAAPAPVPDGDEWPAYARGRTVRQCLGTVFNEEFEHHGFCVRDLDQL